MTVLEPSELRRLKCVFVSDWTCYVQVDEIPLEVCRICLEARRTRATERAKTVTRQISEETERRITLEPLPQAMTANSSETK